MVRLSKCPGVKFPEKNHCPVTHPDTLDFRNGKLHGFDQALTLADRNVCLDVGKVQGIIRGCRLVGMLKHFYINDEWSEQIAKALNERLAEILIEEEKQ